MATKNKNTKKSSNFSLIITILLSLVLVAVIVFGIFVLIKDPEVGKKEDENTKQETTDVKKELKTNTDDELDTEEEDPEPTDTETTYDDTKTGYEAENDKKPVEHDSNGKKVATTSLTIAKAETFIILSGRVTNFKEEGGSCLYYLKKGDTTKQYLGQVIPDAKNTVCEAVKLDKSELGGGQWSVWVEYKSNNAEGKSETQTVDL